VEWSTVLTFLGIQKCQPQSLDEPVTI
jgi:hypothetical protein